MNTYPTSRPQAGGTLQVVLAVLGILLLLCLVAVGAGIWFVKRYVQMEVERSGEAERVAVRTPIGEFEVRKAENVADELRLPVYPGAVAGPDSASVRLRGRLWEEAGGLNVTAAEFRTPDPLEKVDGWYREKLGPGFTRLEGRIVGEASVDVGRRKAKREWEIYAEPGGKDILYKQERDQGVRGVVLKATGSEVEIKLFQVAQAGHQ